MSDRLLLTIEDAAERLSLSATTVKEMLRAGLLVAIRPNGGDRRIAVIELERFVRDAQAAAEAEQRRNERWIRENVGDQRTRSRGTGKQAGVR